MSLLTKQTKSLLGVGEGSIQDFAAGVRTRRKGAKGLSREEALAQATASEGQDARLRHSGDLQPQHDPKKTQGAELMLTTNDRDFIVKARELEKKIVERQGQDIGKNATKRLKQEVKGLLELASASSRGGLEDVWAETYDRIKNASGRIAPGGLVKLKSSFSKAMESTNKVLNTNIDIDTYKFDDPGRVAGQLRGGAKAEKAHSKNARRQTKEGVTKTAVNFWENPEYTRAEFMDQLTVGSRRTRTGSRALSIRDRFFS